MPPNRIGVAASSFRFSLRPRALDGATLDLTPYLMTVTRSKPLDGSSVGSWSVSLKFNRRLEADRRMVQMIQAFVEDDDRGDLPLRTIDSDGNTIESPMEVMVGSKVMDLAFDARGTPLAIYHIEGQDWARALTQGQVRLGAIFQSASVDYVMTGVGIEAQVRTQSAPRMPGFIDVPLWDRFSRVILEGAAGAAQASRTLRNLLAIMLWGVWVDPATNKTLVERLAAHNWTGFGPVNGCPWTLEQLASQAMITPDQLLRQFGAMPYNEVFYSYDPATGEPAIFYRERPFGRRAWGQLPMVVISPDQNLQVRPTQSGAERYTMWKPLSAIAGLQGADMLIDTGEGKIPIVELPDLRWHGVRPFEAQDDHMPPLTRANRAILDWHRARIGKAREWFYHNPRMLTGNATLKPADPRLRIGERALLPIEWSFNMGDAKIQTTPVVEAYVTAITDTMHIDQRNTQITQTTIQFIRGQPPGGIPVPRVRPWTKGAKVVVQRRLIGSKGVLIIGGVEVPVGFRTELRMTDLLHYNQRRHVVGSTVIHSTITGSPAATVRVLNKRGYSTHFEIDGSGVVWQYLDPALHEGIHAGNHNYDSIGIDLTGGGTIPFKTAQYMPLLELVLVLKEHFPELSLQTWPYRERSQTVADWATAQGIANLQSQRGTFAHNQLSDDKSDPSYPAWNSAAWESEIRPAIAGPMG